MKKILVVEDDKEFAERIADDLILNGYIVCIASNGDKGQQSLFSYKPDLIISDIILPGMNGIELLELIRQDPRYIKLPYILLSDKTSNRYVDDGKSAGANACLEKSNDFDELIFSVSALLNKTLPSYQSL
jgi:DNA-binding response OmpR family regulator